MTSPETGEMITVEVLPEETVGQVMERLGYHESTLVRDDYYRDLADNFVGGSRDPLSLLPEGDGDFQPYRLGLPQ